MKLNDYVLIPLDSLDETTKSIAIPATLLADKAYEAGKLDAELSLSFDNPKSRFLNSKVTIK